MPLRIFEPRYIRMVKLACGTQDPEQIAGFGMCMVAPPEDQGMICAVGTHVQIIDFTTLDNDQLLGITVEGLSRFRLQKIWQDDDGLRWGEVELMENWPEMALDNSMDFVAIALSQLYEEHPPLAELYPEPAWERADWLAQRWLEILPLSTLAKQALLEPEDCLPALQFVSRYLDPDRHRSSHDESDEPDEPDEPKDS